MEHHHWSFNVVFRNGFNQMVTNNVDFGKENPLFNGPGPGENR